MDMVWLGVLGVFFLVTFVFVRALEALRNTR